VPTHQHTSAVSPLQNIAGASAPRSNPTGVPVPSSESPISSVALMHYRIAVETGGGVWVGPLRSFRDKYGAIVEAVILYRSPSTKTCLGLPVSQLSARAVRKQIADSDALFAPYCERAATFILRNFNRKGMGLRALRKESEEVYTEVAG
jgi:hypothetical protein